MSIQTAQSRKIAVVSGGSRGIGRSIVLSLARKNVDSVFTYQSNRSEAEKVVSAAAEAEATAVSPGACKHPFRLPSCKKIVAFFFQVRTVENRAGLDFYG
jgi:NAD(P)-dependent dehydrogenase (short-subunit alcohol dehydrogenase family)